MSDDPFPKALTALMADRELSQRELGRILDRKARSPAESVSIFSVNGLVHGTVKPTERLMLAVSNALNIDPDYFAEFRLLMARRELDPDAVGLPHALAALARFESAPRSR